MAELPLPVCDLCRSCRAPVRWVETRQGKRMPINAEPTHSGTLVLYRRAGSDGQPVGGWIVRRAWPFDAPDEPLYTSHFATCPNADAWRQTA